MDDHLPARREPAINAPWPVLVLLAAMTGAYLWQSHSPFEQGIIRSYGFVPADLDDGRFSTLATYQFLHGGWPHVAVNGVMALAFGPPVSRLVGWGVIGAALFFLFYLVCGAFAGLAYAAFHLHDANHQLIGASGAVAGLMGAAARLLYGRGGIAPLTDRRVLGFAAVWVGLNIALGLIGFAPGMEGASVAWEAHLGGFAAGILLVSPLARYFGMSEPRL